MRERRTYRLSEINKYELCTYVQRYNNTGHFSLKLFIIIDRLLSYRRSAGGSNGENERENNFLVRDFSKLATLKMRFVLESRYCDDLVVDNLSGYQRSTEKVPRINRS